MGRRPCCDKVGLNRGPWTIEEDHKLANFILNNGIHCWRTVPKLAGLLRCGKSCRLRWINYLRPDLKRGSFTEMEEDQIIQLHSCLGNRWSKIASHFPGRTDNEIKNHWHTKIKKRLKLLGIDPMTHQPINEQTEKNDADNEKNETVPESNSSEWLEEGSEIKSQDDQAKSDSTKTNENQDQFELIMDQTTETTETKTDLLMNYEILCGSLDLDSWLNQETNNTPTSYRSPFSIEESNNHNSSSIRESPPIQDDPLRQGMDTVDSILSWDRFNPHYADDDFSFQEASQCSSMQHFAVPKFH